MARKATAPVTHKATARLETAFEYESLDDLAEHLARLREAAQESLIALASLLLADAQAAEEAGLRVHSPELRAQIKRAHDLTWYALAAAKQGFTKGKSLEG